VNSVSSSERSERVVNALIFFWGAMEQLNQLTDQVICSAIRVHRELGPGLLESTYEACLEYELLQAGLRVERQKTLPVTYRGVDIECGYRLDLVVENQLVLELKSVEKLMPIHRAQLLSYLKLSGMKLGFLLNFNVNLMKDGLVRISK